MHRYGPDIFHTKAAPVGRNSEAYCAACSSTAIRHICAMRLIPAQRTVVLTLAKTDPAIQLSRRFVARVADWSYSVFHRLGEGVSGRLGRSSALRLMPQPAGGGQSAYATAPNEPRSPTIRIRSASSWQGVRRCRNRPGHGRLRFIAPISNVTEHRAASSAHCICQLAIKGGQYRANAQCQFQIGGIVGS